MDQFDKKIKQKLAKAPKHEPDPEIWANVAPHLNPTTVGRRSSWLQKMMIAASLLTLVGGSFWLGTLYHDQDLKSEMERMSNSIAALQQTERERLRIIDTLVVHDTVWHLFHPGNGQVAHDENVPTPNDNLYRSNNTISTYRPQIFNRDSHWSKSFIDQTIENNYKVLLSNQRRGESERASGSSVVADANDHSDNQIELIDKRFFVPFANFKRKIRLHPYQGLLADQIIKNERSRRFIRSILPKNYRVGLVTGGLNLLLHEIEHSQEWMAGVQIELHFSNRISFLTGIRYRYLQFKQEHDLEEISYPVPVDLQSQDQIREIYADVEYLNLPIILKYSVPLSPRFMPYVHAGLMIGGASSQAYKYEVIRNNQEFKLNVDPVGSSWTLNSYLLGAGLEYSISNRFVLTADFEGRTQFKAAEMEHQKYDGLGMRLGLYYNL